jgi:ankyrin repeat protein
MKIGGKSAADVFGDEKVVTLVKAACDGDIARVEKALSEGADVNRKGYRDTTPLLWAMMCVNIQGKGLQGVERLLQAGADPNYVMSSDETPLWIAAGGNNPELLKLLLRYKGDPGFWGRGGRNALMNAVIQDRHENLRILLDHGADVNNHDHVGQTAATLAAALASWDVVMLLLERGYSYDLEDLARGVQNRVVSPKGEEGKQQALKMLESRGVKLPASQARPPG